MRANAGARLSINFNLRRLRWILHPDSCSASIPVHYYRKSLPHNSVHSLLTRFRPAVTHPILSSPYSVPFLSFTATVLLTFCQLELERCLCTCQTPRARLSCPAASGMEISRERTTPTPTPIQMRSTLVRLTFWISGS